MNERLFGVRPLPKGVSNPEVEHLSSPNLIEFKDNKIILVEFKTEELIPRRKRNLNLKGSKADLSHYIRH